jgi:hypothetical protein
MTEMCGVRPRRRVLPTFASQRNVKEALALALHQGPKREGPTSMRVIPDSTITPCRSGAMLSPDGQEPVKRSREPPGLLESRDEWVRSLRLRLLRYG